MSEQLVLDGLPLNDSAPWSIRGDSFNFLPARKKLNWVTSALGDGAAATGDEDHYENAEMTFTVRAKGLTNKDAALSAWHELTQKLQAARPSISGIPLVWIPDESSGATTWYVVNAEYDELHISKEGGWFDNQPEVQVHLYLRPFGYGAESVLPLGYTDPFDFESILGGQWRWDTTPGTVAVSGGAMTVSSTAQKRLYLPFTAEDFSIKAKIYLGATLTTGQFKLMKRLGTSDYVYAGLNVGGTLRITKDTTADPAADLVSETVTLAASTAYWLVATFAGDDVNASLYADTDSDLTTPLVSAAITLTGTDATTFGSGIRANPGVFIIPNSTDWTMESYQVRGMPDVKSSEPLVTVEIPDVPGHVNAEARQLITDGSNKNRRHYEWGLEWRGYDSDASLPLLLDSDALTVTGYAGVQTTVGTGDLYDPHAATTDAIYATNLSSVAAVTICSTGYMGHVGAFKVKARVWGSAGVKVRLAYEIGDSFKTRNAYTAPIEGPYQEVDLGTVVIPQAVVGTHAWQAWVEAYGVDDGTFGIDYLMLIPVERYGVLRAPLVSLVPDVFTVRDSFNQASNPAIDNLVLPIAPSDTGPVSGKWHSSGSGTGDFTVDSTNHWVQRIAESDTNTASGRFAVVGNAAASNFTACQVRCDLAASGYGGSVVPANVSRFGVVARYVDANNWLMAVREAFVGDAGTSRARLRIYKRVASVTTQIGSHEMPGVQAGNNLTFILSADATGVWQVFYFPAGTAQPSVPARKGEDVVLATGGALATGKVGIYDAYTATVDLTRRFDNFSSFATGGEVILAGNRKLEVRSDRAEREGAASIYGRVVPEGSNFYLPPAGDAQRVTRMVSKLRRNNVDEGLPDTNVGDDVHTLQVFGTGRYLHPVSG